VITLIAVADWADSTRRLLKLSRDFVVLMVPHDSS